MPHRMQRLAQSAKQSQNLKIASGSHSQHPQQGNEDVQQENQPRLTNALYNMRNNFDQRRSEKLLKLQQDRQKLKYNTSTLQNQQVSDKLSKMSIKEDSHNPTQSPKSLNSSRNNSSDKSKLESSKEHANPKVDLHGKNANYLKQQFSDKQQAQKALGKSLEYIVDSKEGDSYGSYLNKWMKIVDTKSSPKSVKTQFGSLTQSQGSRKSQEFDDIGTMQLQRRG
eukprot:TRINITY_DN23510_c0_g1_i1.p1 TRINITY_DN23510_c0_g1~~TRINITY_DN23510_c0_g1_i1.p1  ORF type:complete len:224 (-),score=12.34 TRINITY_DN23510_c0_g1_i1:219-890(-)